MGLSADVGDIPPVTRVLEVALWHLGNGAFHRSRAYPATFTHALDPAFDRTTTMRRRVSSVQDIVLQPASNRDTERVAALVIRILREFGLQPDFESSEADLQDIEATYPQSGGMFKLVEDTEGDLLGTFAVQRLDDETCKLRKMYLVPEVRGLGLGRYMLGQAIRDARELGFKTMILETVSVLEDAIRLYTRAGFAPARQDAGSPRCDQVYSLALE